MRRRVPVAIVGALALVLAGCGGDDDTTAGGEPEFASEEQTERGSGASGERVNLPAVTVVDVATGDDVDLTTLLPSDRPLLAWFWAPH